MKQQAVGVSFTSYLGNESLLDHNYVSEELKILKTKIFTCERSVSDHYATFLIVDYQVNKPIRRIITTRLFKKFNAHQFYDNAIHLPFLQIAENKQLSVSDRLVKIESLIIGLLDRQVPEKQLRVRGKTNPWLSKDLLHLIDTKNKFYKRVYQTGTPATDNQLNQYNKFKNYTTNMIKKAKKRYYSTSLSRDSKSFFKGLQKLTGKGKSTTNIDRIMYKENVFTSDKDIADAMNSFFTNIPGSLAPTTNCRNSRQSIESDSKETNELLSFEPVTSDTVLKQLRSLKPQKRGGVSEMPTFVYQSIADLLALPISMLINECFSSSSFPDCLKIAIVTPIYKKGDKNNPSNYRPISSLPIISKIFEINIKNQLMSFLEQEKLICNRQFGYRKHHSTEQLILSLLQEWRSNLDNSAPCYISALSLDVKKAFDSVNHNVLVNNLPKFNLSCQSIKLISSYLERRQQVMKIGLAKSSSCHIQSGVPQGSILGPVLFNLAINDLLSTNPTSFAYADDTVIYTKSESPEKSVQLCQTLLANVHEWYRDNCLQLNLSKTQFCMFSNRKLKGVYTINIDDLTIHSNDSLSLLGIKLDPKLDLISHTHSVASKACSLLYLTSKLKKYLNVEQLLQTYTLLIRPRLEYCSSILLACTQKNSNVLENVQNRAIRIILSAPKKFSVTTGRLLLNLPTLSSRRLYLFHRFVHTKMSKMLASYYLLDLVTKSYLHHSFSLRSAHSLVKPTFRTNLGKTSFINQYHSFLSNYKCTSKDLLSFHAN
jgi:hypothetical protein